MKNKRFLGVLVVLMGVGQAWADLTSDSKKTAEWFSEQVGELMAFQAASTHFMPADTVGFPGAEVGLAGNVAATKLDVDKFRGLSLTTLDNKSSQISLPASISVPGGVLQAKVGIPGGWDLGLKAGSTGLNKKEGDAKTDFKNKVFGVEVRKQLLGGGLTGVALPDLSVSLAYDKASGDLTRTEVYNGPVLSGGNMTANTTWKSSWNVGAVTARAIVSKKLVFITPFAGLGVSKMTGTTDTNVDIAVTSGSQSSTNVTGSAKANDTVTHLLAGVELSLIPFTRINLSGLAAKDHWSASLGLRVQFP